MVLWVRLLPNQDPNFEIPPSKTSNLSPTLSSLKGRVRIHRQQAGTEGMISPHSFAGNKTEVRQLAALSFTATYTQGTENSSPPLPSLKLEQATQRPARRWPEPPNGNNGGHPAPAARALLPGRARRPHTGPHPRSPAGRGERGRRCGATPAAPHPTPPAPEARPDPRAGAERGGQGKVTHRGSAPARAHPAPGAAAQRLLRFRGPLKEHAAGRPASAPPGIAAAAADFLARSKLWPRLHFSTAPAAFPRANARAEPRNPTRTRANRRQHRAGGGGPEGGSAYPRARGAGQAWAVTRSH